MMCENRKRKTTTTTTKEMTVGLKVDSDLPNVLLI